MHLRNFDLNLLLAFEALLSERNVTRAATRIGLTQPAMSHALQRLRNAFNDPLFVREAGGMQPTRTAINLAPLINDILNKAGSLVDAGRSFQPGTSQRLFTIGMTDYAASRMLPAVSAEIHRLAPHTRLVVRPVARGDGPSAIESGEVDLAVGIFLNVQHLCRHLLEEERLLCAVWKGNTSVDSRLSLTQYLALQHVLVATRGDPGGLVEQALGKLGVQRSIFCTVPHALVASAIVKGTNLALTLGEGVLHDHKERYELKLLKPPFELPKVRLEMLWHKRMDGDIALRWLRDLIVRTSRQGPQQHCRR